MIRKKRYRKKRRYKRGKHISPKLLNCPANYRSGWELLYMQWLDNNNDVISYAYESFSIDYVSNVKTNKIRKYYPDILVNWVDGTKTLVEIKPRSKLHQRINQKKILAANDWCKENNINFNIVTEDTLKELKIL